MKTEAQIGVLTPVGTCCLAVIASSIALRPRHRSTIDQDLRTPIGSRQVRPPIACRACKSQHGTETVDDLLIVEDPVTPEELIIVEDLLIVEDLVTFKDPAVVENQWSVEDLVNVEDLVDGGLLLGVSCYLLVMDCHWLFGSRCLTSDSC